MLHMLGCRTSTLDVHCGMPWGSALGTVKGAGLGKGEIERQPACDR